MHTVVPGPVRAGPAGPRVVRAPRREVAAEELWFGHGGIVALGVEVDNLRTESGKEAHMNRISSGMVLIVVSALMGCDSGPTQITQDDLKAYFAKHRVGSSADYAIVKNGTDYLATVHGYMDDGSVCEQLIAPYNKNPALSVLPGTYSCVPLNK